MKINYELISPSGNPTAIINGFYKNDVKQRLNQTIFKANPLVEQIGYVYKQKQQFYFDMMGNEFSGNGCRAAAYSLLNKNNGQIEFKASGIKKPVIGIVSGNISQIIIPCFLSAKNIISQKPFCLKIFSSLIYVFDKKISQNQIAQIISQNPDQPAIGFMYFTVTAKNISLQPCFYVKKTGTLVDETACGSGSITTAFYLKFSKILVNNQYNILQPSGKILAITLSPLSLSGPIKFIKKYNVTI